MGAIISALIRCWRTADIKCAILMAASLNVAFNAAQEEWCVDSEKLKNREICRCCFHASHIMHGTKREDCFKCLRTFNQIVPEWLNDNCFQKL